MPEPKNPIQGIERMMKLLDLLAEHPEPLGLKQISQVTELHPSTAHRILSVPDFIANAGGVICAAIEYAGGTEAQAFAAIEERIRANTRETLAQARAGGLLPREAATRMARARVEEAMRYRKA